MNINDKPHILVVIANFYQSISQLQLDAVTKTLHDNNVSYDVISVAGALEIPVVIAVAAQTQKYHGYVALGCVIRGETTHYDTVCTESARALMDLSIHKNLAIGNGILTVENESQALERADITKLNKAGGAVMACLGVIKIFNMLQA